MTDPKTIYSGSYEWKLDESGSPDSEALAERSAEEGVTIYGSVEGEPATAFRGETFVRGERITDGHVETHDKVSGHLDS